MEDKGSPQRIVTKNRTQMQSRRGRLIVNIVRKLKYELRKSERLIDGIIERSRKFTFGFNSK